MDDPQAWRAVAGWVGSSYFGNTAIASRLVMVREGAPSTDL